MLVGHKIANPITWRPIESLQYNYYNSISISCFLIYMFHSISFDSIGIWIIVNGFIHYGIYYYELKLLDG